jgi:predicted membrane channel-forming protein YqfA (hemolysin III family)
MLVAGTYTTRSACDSMGWILFGLVWGQAALGGVTLKAVGVCSTRRLSTGLFRVMGGCRRANLVSHAESGNSLASAMTDNVYQFFAVLSFEA